LDGLSLDQLTRIANIVREGWSPEFQARISKVESYGRQMEIRISMIPPASTNDCNEVTAAPDPRLQELREKQEAERRNRF
jgi:hypothetical protein